MGNFDITLFDHCVLQGRIYLSMPQKLLKLLNRHSVVDCHRCKSTPELVRMYFLKSQPFSKFTQANLDAADFQSFVR